MDPAIFLTIDVEDWFQVENFKRYIPYSSWSSHELRVERNTLQILDLFDSFRAIQNSKFKTQNSFSATFFVLGWIAHRLPRLVREIHARGHEVASHGYFHKLCSDQSSQALEMDLCDSKKLLEDIIGSRVYGYRAPSFSISDNVLDTIQKCGYLYDSSYNSFGFHGRYGRLDLPENGHDGIAIPINRDRYSNVPSSSCSNSVSIDVQNPESRTQNLFYELPINNLEFCPNNSKFKFVLPWGGGCYFRLIPFNIFKQGIKMILERRGAYLFYMHPWEIDPGQPRVLVANCFYRFRQCVNLDKTFSRLKRLLCDFDFCSFISCSEYLNLKMDQMTKSQAHK